jgi:ABC-type lipoprotein export system ATPase subunit
MTDKNAPNTATSTPPAATTPFVVCRSIVKVYRVGESEIVALRGIDFTMTKGEMISIIGPSGAGKSSLLNLLGGLDMPTAGKLIVDSLDLLSLKGKALADYRLNRVGFLWQQVERNLIPHRTALHNIDLPMLLASVPPSTRRLRAQELLEMVGLANQADKLPSQMSGGQQQRVALAVALANHPQLILLDEPTGSLDRQTAGQVMKLIQDMRRRYNLTVLMVTHDLNMAGFADRVLTLRDGALGQDLAHVTDSSPTLDSAGRITLPELVRIQLADAPRIGVEIRPEGVLLRPEYDTVDTHILGGKLLPQDAAPKRKRFRLFGRNGATAVQKTG